MVSGFICKSGGIICKRINSKHPKHSLSSLSMAKTIHEEHGLTQKRSCRNESQAPTGIMSLPGRLQQRKPKDPGKDTGPFIFTGLARAGGHSHNYSSRSDSSVGATNTLANTEGIRAALKWTGRNLCLGQAQQEHSQDQYRTVDLLLKALTLWPETWIVFESHIRYPLIDQFWS